MAEFKNIFQKLLAVQKRINGLGKDKKTYAYSYVTGDKVLGEIKPIMNEVGLLLKQEVISIENVRQDYQTKGGPQSEINSKVMMRFTWICTDTGEKDECLFGANGQNAWDKGVGSALTYGERYFLLKYFHIATDEDDIDNPDRKPTEKQAAPKTPAPVEAPRFASPEQKEAIIKTLTNPVFTKEERDAIIGQINKYTPETAEKNHNGLKARIEKRVAEKLEASKELIEFLNQNKELIPADKTKEYYDLINDPKVQAAEVLKAKEILVDSLANAA